jgi:hypothetical protein
MVGINIQIQKVLDHGANLNHRAAPAPLREGVASTRVSLFLIFFGRLCDLNFSSHSWPCAGSQGAPAVNCGVSNCLRT